jgi:hypothetical protein
MLIESGRMGQPGPGLALMIAPIVIDLRGSAFEG